jgi:hypothetical protein
MNGVVTQSDECEGSKNDLSLPVETRISRSTRNDKQPRSRTFMCVTFEDSSPCALLNSTIPNLYTPAAPRDGASRRQTRKPQRLGCEAVRRDF